MTGDSQYYNSYKDDDDLILEYNQVSLDDSSVTPILDIEMDNLSRKQAVYSVMQMIESEEEKVNHVMMLNPYKLHRMRFNKELREIAVRANLRLNAGSGLTWAAKRLGAPLKERIGTMSFMMDLIRISESKEYTIFLVGGKPEITERAFFNIKKSFPKIRIVGRHGGYFSSDRERSVIEAIRKSEANIVFVGLGFPKEDRWIHRMKKEFKKTVFVGVGGSLDIVSGEIKKAPPFFMNSGSDWFYRIITRPWRLGRLLRTVLFFITIFFKGLFRKK